MVSGKHVSKSKYPFCGCVVAVDVEGAPNKEPVTGGALLNNVPAGLAGCELANREPPIGACELPNRELPVAGGALPKEAVVVGTLPKEGIVVGAFPNNEGVIEVLVLGAVLLVDEVPNAPNPVFVVDPNISNLL